MTYFIYICLRVSGRCNPHDRVDHSCMQVIDLAAKLNRGLEASKQDQAEMENLVQQLEQDNPNPKSLAADEINGKWRLIYTTSESILGTKRPAPFRPSGSIFQSIGKFLNR